MAPHPHALHGSPESLSRCGTRSCWHRQQQSGWPRCSHAEPWPESGHERRTVSLPAPTDHAAARAVLGTPHFLVCWIAYTPAQVINQRNSGGRQAVRLTRFVPLPRCTPRRLSRTAGTGAESHTVGRESAKRTAQAAWITDPQLLSAASAAGVANPLRFHYADDSESWIDVPAARRRS